jgi:hypothetical protein
MRFFLPLIISVLVAGCAGKQEVGVTHLPSLDFYSGSFVPLSADAHINSSVSKSEMEYLQKAVANDSHCGNAAIDGIYKTKGDEGEVIEVRRSIYFWQFKHGSNGEWQLIAHGEWLS